MSETYERYIRSSAWKARRNKKLRNALWVGRRVLCRGCRCLVLFSTGDIHVHHLNYDRLGAERDSDLAVLCSGCHAFVHGNEPPNWWTNARKARTLGAMSVKEFKTLVIAFLEVGQDSDEAAISAASVLAPRIGPSESQAREMAKQRRRA